VDARPRRRLAALALGGALLEIVAVSQVSIFGGVADLSPLVVMAAGMLCGSVAGAVVGFGAGLFLDLALVQTLGLSSLVLLLVGYWAGRLREVRDPQGTLVPLAVGAVATLMAEAGYGSSSSCSASTRRSACCSCARSSPRSSSTRSSRCPSSR